MNDIRLEMIGILGGKKYIPAPDIARRVYSEEGLCPTIHWGVVTWEQR